MKKNVMLITVLAFIFIIVITLSLKYVKQKNARLSTGCSYEICGDGIDNDCDGIIDEADCKNPRIITSWPEFLNAMNEQKWEYLFRL